MSMPPLTPPGGPTGTPSSESGAAYGEWHTCKLGGIILPGKWTLVSGGIKLKVDPMKKPGVDGGNPVFHGLNAQPFEIDGEQYSDDERSLLQSILATLLPQPGASEKSSNSVNLDHASTKHFGFAINVKIVSCSILKFVSPGVSKLSIGLIHILPPKGNTATVQPRTVKRYPGIGTQTKEAREKASSAATALPTTQPNVAAPPANFTPGPGS